MDTVKSFLRGIRDVALLVIPLSVVLGIIFGPAVPFIGTAVVDNISGLVSDLGRVNNKYLTALEVAAGSRINSLIVDTDKTAANCIEYLRHNKLGSVTFLPLNKIRLIMQKLKKQLNFLAFVNNIKIINKMKLTVF